MSVFGLLLVLTLLSYCLVQVFRDFRRKSYVMLASGVLISIFLLYIAAGLFYAPGGY